MLQKVNGVPDLPRMSDRTMAQVSGSQPSRPIRRRPRWTALRPTPRFRRQLIQAGVVAVIAVAVVAGLAFVFGIIILQYAMGGLVVSSIVIVAAIGLTVLYGIRGFANFAYGDLMTLGAYLALLLSLNGLSSSGEPLSRFSSSRWSVSCSRSSSLHVSKAADRSLPSSPP